MGECICIYMSEGMFIVHANIHECAYMHVYVHEWANVYNTTE